MKIDKNLNNASGIYCIENTINNKKIEKDTLYVILPLTKNWVNSVKLQKWTIPNQAILG